MPRYRLAIGFVAGALFVGGLIGYASAAAPGTYTPPCTANTDSCRQQRIVALENHYKGHSHPSPTPTPSSSATSPSPSPTPSASSVSPSPTPSETSVSPSPTPSGGNNCMPDPSVCGFPDIETVGVSAGVSLTPVSGVVHLSTDGQIYENKVVTGSIQVEAKNVTIRNVKLISQDPYYGIRVLPWDNTDQNLTVDHVEIDADGSTQIKGIAFNGYTAKNVFFHNGSDCAHFGEKVTIEDSLCAVGPDVNDDGWPDGSSFCSGTDHFDGYQSDGADGVTLRHNTVRNPCGQTSAILMSSNTSTIKNVVIKDNLLAGGGYSLYCNAGPDVANETVTGNRFAKTWYPKSGYWGPTTGCEDANVFTGNVWDADGSALGG